MWLLIFSYGLASTCFFRTTGPHLYNKNNAAGRTVAFVVDYHSLPDRHG
jgi:hypothetical protein